MNVEKLETWFLQHKRDLNFRNFSLPYHVWVSEIMLQQTQAETVEPYFSRFINVYPSVEALANAKDDDLKRLVEGIGYYRRFSYMKKAAQIIVDAHQKKFPDTIEDLLKLPGVGKYTAGAIMSIAYNKPYSALDGNVVRVLSRYLGKKDNMREEKFRNELDRYNQQIIEKAHPKIYSEAMIELGALVCKPKNPLCNRCPLNEDCIAYQHDLTKEIPYLSKLKKQKEIYYITFVIRDIDHVYLVKRTERLLEGMYSYLQFERESLSKAIDDLEDEGIYGQVSRKIGSYRHVFSHQIWFMDVHEFYLLRDDKKRLIKLNIDHIHDVPMAVAHRKIKTV